VKPIPLKKYTVCTVIDQDIKICKVWNGTSISIEDETLLD